MPASSQLGTCSTVRSSGSAGASGEAVAASSAGCCPASPLCSACFCAASVALKSSASGPSRMLARRRAIEHLLREVAVSLRSGTGRVVLEHRAALDGRFGVADGLLDPGFEHQVSERSEEHTSELQSLR